MWVTLVPCPLLHSPNYFNFPHNQVPWVFHPVMWAIPPVMRLLRFMLGAGAGAAQLRSPLLPCLAFCCLVGCS